jgi:hypothetical protein
MTTIAKQGQAVDKACRSSIEGCLPNAGQMSAKLVHRLLSCKMPMVVRFAGDNSQK